MSNKFAISVAFLVIGIFPAYGSDAANSIIKRAQKACTSEKGQFHVAEDATQQLDLNNDWQIDEIIDEGKFSCSTASSLYCGTGGCMIHILVNGKDYNYLARAWKITELDKEKIIIMSVHWSECNYKNPCLKAIAWRDGRFRSLK